MAKAPSDMAARFLLRLPAGMRERISEIAAKSGRSMNAEIIARLEASLDAEPQQPAEEDVRRIVREEIRWLYPMDWDLLSSLRTGKKPPE